MPGMNPNRHRGRLEVQYTDDGTCYKDKQTGLYIRVRKMYGYEAYDVSIHEHSTALLTARPKPAIGSRRFEGRPKRQELTEWLDSVLA